MPSCSPKVHGSGQRIPHGHIHHSNTTCAPSSREKPGCLPTEARQKPTRSSKSENRHQCWRTDYTTWGDYRRTQGFLPNPDTSTRFLRRPPQQLSLCRRLAGWGDATPKISLSCKSCKSRHHGRPPWWSRLGWRGGVGCSRLSFVVTFCLSTSVSPRLSDPILLVPPVHAASAVFLPSARATAHARALWRSPPISQHARGRPMKEFP